jgi:hypothetical protein
MTPQPKDQTDPIYAIVSKYLQHGDQKIIAIELEVSPGLVSSVKHGRIRSKRIWDRIVEVCMNRKDSEERFLQYMSDAKAK